MINGKIIKVCGMCEAENIRDVEALEGIDMLGFIFYPKSPRYIYELPAYLPIRAKRVGVFVNADKPTVSMYADRFGLCPTAWDGITGILPVTTREGTENHQSIFNSPTQRLDKGI